MSGPRWIYQKHLHSSGSNNLAITGLYSQPCDTPQLSFPSPNFNRLSLSDNRTNVSNVIFNTFDSSSEDETKKVDPEAVKGNSYVSV